MKSLNYTARFIELASEINTNMPRFAVDKVQDALNNVGKSVKGSQVLVLGLRTSLILMTFVKARRWM